MQSLINRQCWWPEFLFHRNPGQSAFLLCFWKHHKNAAPPHNGICEKRHPVLVPADWNWSDSQRDCWCFFQMRTWETTWEGAAVFHLLCSIHTLSVCPLNSTHAETLLESAKYNLWLCHDLELHQKPCKRTHASGDPKPYKWFCVMSECIRTQAILHLRSPVFS